MRQNISLYLGDMEVEFNQPPSILYNYTQDEITNPTVIKNSYSKTITLVGTNKNNQIFGHFWNLERITEYGAYDGVYFNATKKTPFKLFCNGELYESGYAKLSEVRKNDKGIEYDIELYGGLSQFFWGLTTNNETGNKLKLSDLDYMGNDNPNEFDITISQDTVYDAWFQSTPNAGTGNKWHYINFCTAYNGYPKDMDCDKVLGNTNGGVLFGKADEDGKPMGDASAGNTYMAYGDSYVLAELPEKLTEWEIGDIRSGLQRPVIRMKEIINACNRYMAKPENGSWQVTLDSDFFNSDNPYWENTWMTLPMLTEMNYINEQPEATGYTPTISLQKINNNLYQINGIEGTFGTLTLSGRVRLPILSAYSSYTHLYTNQTTRYWVSPFQKNSREYNGAISITLEALDGLGNVICETPSYFLTNTTVADRPNITRVDGWFTKRDGYYYWTNTSDQIQDIVFNLNLMGRRFERLVLKVEWIHNSYQSGPGVLYGERKVNKNNGNKSDVPVYTNGLSQLIPLVAYISANAFTATRLSGTKFTKQIMLDTSKTPCDYLLSYCKLFNLHFLKDVEENKIEILTRKNFYDRSQAIDLQGLIDRSKPINITPTVFNAKWYDFKLENVEGEFAQDYKNTTTYDFGVKRINTGYDFDGSVKDLLKDNALKGAVQSVEKSKYYSYYLNSDNGIQTWMLDGFSYPLYHKDDSGTTVDIKYDQRSFENVQGINTLKYYDLFSKPQFHSEDNKPLDGSNVLLFFTGYKNTVADDGTKLNYWLTDDLDNMYLLNGNSCWLYTADEYDEYGNKIATKLNSLPTFSRYWLNGSNITYSLDFGQPRQLYVPNISTNENSTIYNNYWKTYIEDMYDVDSKVLDCNVRLETKPNPNWLRRFYWFDNCIWRINKIEDWNISDFTTTKMQFIKVFDMNNYSSIDTDGDDNLTITANKYIVPDTGGTVTFTVTASDGGCWIGDDNWYHYFQYTPSGCGHSTTFSVDIPAYTGGRTLKLNVIGEQDQRGNGVSILQEKILFTVEETGKYATMNIPAQGAITQYVVKSTYPWTVTSNQTYCKPQTTQGTGNTSGETISVVWDMSDVFGQRSATLSFVDINGNVVTKFKIQNGVNYSNLIYPYTGGTKVINTPSGASVNTKPDWISIVDNGNGTYDVVAEYNSGDYRYGNIILQYENGKTFTVIAEQEAYQTEGDNISGNTMHLSVKQYGNYVNALVPYNGAVLNYNVKSTSPWTAVSNKNYCILQTTGGTGNTLYGENINVVWQQSDDYRNRVAILTFINDEGYRVTVTKTQEGLAYGQLHYPATGGTKIIYYDDNAEVLTKPNWITINYIGDGEYEITAAENEDYERSGNIVFQGNSRLTILCTQDESEDAGLVKSFHITPLSLYWTHTGGTQYLQVTDDKGDNWRIISKPNWVTFAPQQGSTSAIVTASVGNYTGTTTRTGYTTIYNVTLDREYNIYCQQSSENSEGSKSITITPNPATIGGSGGTVEVTINYVNRNGDFLMAVTSGVTVGKIKFTGDTANVKITVPQNETFSGRTFTVVFQGEDISGTLTINQAAADPYLEVEPTNLTFGTDGGNTTITISTNDSFTIE